MKNMSNLTISGFIAAAAIALGGIYRYFIAYNDPSEAALWTGIGVLLALFSWMYNRQLNQGNTVTALEDYLADKTKDKEVEDETEN